ncbi:MAG: AEC family transporter [Verrucomicrobiota bacterium]
MITPTTILLSVLPVYLLIIGGAVLRRVGLLKPNYDTWIMPIIFWVMAPCFILDRMLGAVILRDSSTLATGIGLGFSLIIAGIGIGYLVGKAIGLAPGNGMRTFALASGCQNYGYTAVPVVEILWGTSAVAVLFVHNIGVEIAIWSFGVMLLSGDRKMNWKRMINGPIIAVGIGLILVLLHIDHKVTGSPRDIISMIGIAAFPLALVMTGASMMDLVGTEKPSWKIILGSVLVRMLLTPILIIASAKWIPMSLELRQVLLVQAAMPAAMVPILLAKIYGGRPVVAVQIVIATTIVSIFTLPYIITYGMRFLDLTPIKP